MKRTVFKNKLFYALLIGLIIVLLIYNVYVLINSNSLFGIIPILFEVILLILILSKNEYAKMAILIWVAISLIIGFGFEAVANLIDDFNSNFETFKTGSFLFNISGLAIGIIIIDYTKRTVVVDFVLKDSNKEAN